MYTDFHKEDWHSGSTTYLICMGEDPKTVGKEKQILEGLVITVGRKYITVFADNKKIRFETNKEAGWIYHPAYEIYLNKDCAASRLKKWDIQKELKQHAANMLFGDFKNQTLDQLEFLNRLLNSMFATSGTGDLFTQLSEALTTEEKDVFYRRIWTKYVEDDIRSYSSGENIELSEEDIEKTASSYTNGNYDCNLSYWENICGLIHELVEAVA